MRRKTLLPVLATRTPLALQAQGCAVLTVEVRHLGQDHARGGRTKPLVQLEGAGARSDGVGGVRGVRALHLRVRVGERRVLPGQRGRRRRRRVAVDRVTVERRLRPGAPRRPERPRVQPQRQAPCLRLRRRRRLRRGGAGVRVVVGPAARPAARRAARAARAARSQKPGLGSGAQCAASKRGGEALCAQAVGWRAPRAAPRGRAAAAARPATRPPPPPLPGPAAAAASDVTRASGAVCAEAARGVHGQQRVDAEILDFSIGSLGAGDRRQAVRDAAACRLAESVRGGRAAPRLGMVTTICR